MSQTYELGRIGLVFRGVYNAEKSYVPLDAVFYQGSSYLCKLACTNVLPTDTDHWNLMAQGYPGIEPWTTLTLPAWVSSTTLGDGALRMRREGSHVFICGGVSAHWNGSAPTLITTLPEGYRPLYSNRYFFRPCGGANIARMFISTDGNVYLEWIVTLTNCSAVTSIRWIDCAMDFWTDEV